METKNEMLNEMENEVLTAETTAVETTAVETTAAVVENEGKTSLVPLSSYWGMDADDVTKAMLARSDVKNHSDLIITNIVDNSDKGMGRITIVVAKSLPQYLLNADTGAYELGTTRNIFTTRIQLAAILKGQGETQIAKIVESAPFEMIVPILEKGRISIMSRLLAAGEAYVNPYASKAPAEERITEHDRMEFFPYEIKLGVQFSPLEKMQLAMMLVKM